MTTAYYFSFDETFNVGVDRGTPVVDDYLPVRNRFEGRDPPGALRPRTEVADPGAVAERARAVTGPPVVRHLSRPGRRSGCEVAASDLSASAILVLSAGLTPLLTVISTRPSSNSARIWSASVPSGSVIDPAELAVEPLADQELRGVVGRPGPTGARDGEHAVAEAQVDVLGVDAGQLDPDHQVVALAPGCRWPAPTPRRGCARTPRRRARRRRGGRSSASAPAR